MLKVENMEGTTLAFLNNVTDATIHEVLNGEYTLSFIVTIDPLKTDFLYDKNNRINYEEDLFKVVTLEEIHTEDESITISVVAEHISYELLENIMEDFNYLNKAGLYVMNKCLEGTKFRCIYTDVDIKTDIQYTQSCNSKEISIAIAHNWRGELEYHRYDIRLLKQRGQNRGVDFRFGKNLKSIKRIINFANDTVAYEVDVEQGAELEELGYFELGDTIRVVDDALGIEIETRIVELEKNILTGLNSSVVLGDKIEDLRNSFSGIDEAKKKAEDAENIANDIKDTVDRNKTNWDKVNTIINENDQVIADNIAGIINTSNATIQNTTGTITWTGNTIKIHDQPEESQSNWCMELGAGGWRIADSKKSDGTWNWSTMATGKGINANEITTGELSAVNIRGVKIIGTEIIGGSITGINISGSTIVGGVPEGIHTLITPNEPFKVKRGSNGIVAELWAHEVGGGSYLRLYGLEDLEGSEPKIELRSGGTFSHLNANKTSLDINVTANIGQQASGRMNINVDKEFKVNKDGKMWIGIAENNVSYFGQSGCQTYIDGDVYLENPKSLNLSELEVRNLELEYENRQLGLKLSELEVALMERGVL